MNEGEDTTGVGGSDDERLGLIARSLEQGDRDLTAPPDSLWQAITTELEADGPSSSGGSGGELHTMTPRPAPAASKGWRGVALAAAAALVLIVGVVSLARGRDQVTEVASAEIVNDGLPVSFGESGSARIVEDGDELILDVELPDLPETDGFYEVWLIDSDVEGMVSLGPADAEGRLVIPSSVDPADFPVVDVSAEPVDGDPTHSGASILRGVLTYQ